MSELKPAYIEEEVIQKAAKQIEDDEREWWCCVAMAKPKMDVEGLLRDEDEYKRNAKSALQSVNYGNLAPALTLAKDALVKYGSHTSDCMVLNRQPQCTCGFDAALSAINAELKE